LAGARRHLTNEGRLVIEIFNPSLPLLSRDPEQRHPVGQYQPAGGGGVTVTVKARYDAASQVNHIQWFYLDETSGEETSLSLEMRQFYPQEADALLEYNGFIVERKFGDYSEALFSSASPKQLIVCRKR
jgi:hypothetical protein